MLTPMMKMLMVVMMRRARITSDGRIVRVAWKAAMLTSFPAIDVESPATLFQST